MARTATVRRESRTMRWLADIALVTEMPKKLKKAMLQIYPTKLTWSSVLFLTCSTASIASCNERSESIRR